MSLFEELKRRNVFRVGVAYAVAAWVLLQIFDVVGEILELPAWGGKLILAMLIIGFVLALIFAWAYELTPEGVKREKDIDRSRSITPQTGRKLNRLIIALMAVAIVYLLVDKLYLAPRLAAQTQVATGTEAAAPAPPAGVSRQSIAVLPFDNRSRQEEDEYFVEGIHDDLLTNLARIGSLKVISRTSVAQYKDTTKTIPQIAGELGVATVMEGAVQRAGNAVRINVQLIDAQTDEHLWAEIFDRELTADNLFAIQSEISQKIAEALQAALSPEEQHRLNEHPTDNLAAYNAYLRGRQLMARRTSQDLDQAAVEFERAVELDPQFALAWVGVAETANLRAGYSNLDFSEALRLRAEATRRALELDDQLGEAHLGQATILNYYGRTGEADAAYRRAIELSPGYATAYMWYSGALREYPERLQEAVELGRKAVELDPLSSVALMSLADCYRVLGQYDEAQGELQRLLQLDPDFAPAYSSMAEIMWNTGRLPEEVSWRKQGLELDPGRVAEMMSLAITYLTLDDDVAFADLRERMVDAGGQSFWVAYVDMLSNVYAGNDAGAREALMWLTPRAQGNPFFGVQAAWVYSILGDYPAARQALLSSEPMLLEPSSWPAFIQVNKDLACMAGWVLLRSGDQQSGLGLLTQSAEYLEDTLPKYIEDPHRYSAATCYAALGARERALDALEARFANGHYEIWQLLSRWPPFEPLWGDPRFEAALRQAEQATARQREEVIRMEAAGTARL
jgi:TolB-like protein/predicted Zn-dependent protease